ncbi:UNKNOWN [Stylonychia lemnae]|uniref:Uncharacterized protein n=1 Tax=Stylonychia lemnae TaxID=5949 RepID=A0A077ZSM3_STYLE|nr:UNKNOWN [Stylonychia lemnae]|eukprot:CDW72883.1 UNKNOWN [Stylonychia lemnae]
MVVQLRQKDHLLLMENQLLAIIQTQTALMMVKILILQVKPLTHQVIIPTMMAITLTQLVITMTLMVITMTLMVITLTKMGTMKIMALKIHQVQLTQMIHLIQLTILDYQIDINKYISDPGTQRYRRQSEETGKIVQRAFKNIGAKLILNFGKKVQPVFKNLVEASGNYKLTDNTSYQQCDQTCAAKCLDLNKLSMGDLEVFDRNCVNSCGCYLEYQLLNEDDQRKQRQVYRDLQTNSKRLEKFVERLAKAEKDAKWSVEDYEFELALHKDEFAQVVKDVTNDLTNCDQECINDCVDGQWVNYFEIPKCMSRCQCGQDLFKVGNADFNFPSLIQYSGRDKQAWSLFRMTQNKY